MSLTIKDIRDDEIRIIGTCCAPKPQESQEPENARQRKSPRKQWRLWIAIVLIVSVLACIALLVIMPKFKAAKQETPKPGIYEELNTEVTGTHQSAGKLGHIAKSKADKFVEFIDTTINDIPLRLFIPHNARMSLHVGPLNLQDSTVIFAAQAAFIHGENDMKILGAFVLKGKPLAWGKSLKGFCASIDGKVTVGTAENTSLFEEATERGGYFFRQYPLVKDGKLVENKLKNKSIRRAICDRDGEILMVESQTKESFHDFAQALVDLGVNQAVNLVGSDAYGWAVDINGKRHNIGDIKYYTEDYKIPENTSYMIWK